MSRSVETQIERRSGASEVSAMAEILIVDDEPNIVRLFERLLRREGYQVQGFTSPVEALAWLKQHTADLVLLDVRMPGMDGFQFMEKARQLAPEMGVLIITAYGTLEMALEAVNRGADGMVLKPMESGAQLQQAVQRALAVRQQKQAGALLPVLRSVLSVSEMLFAETRPDRLHSLIVHSVMTLLGSNAALLAERGEDDGLDVKAYLGPRPFPQRLADPPLLLTQALTQKTLVRAREGDERATPWLTRWQLAEEMAVSMEKDGHERVIWVARESRFTAAEAELLRILARQGAAALQNAHLYESLRQAVTELETSRRLMAQAEKLATMGRLMATIAHEINNPLQAVRNSLHLAAHPDLPPRRRWEYLDLARTELDRLEETVRRMLEYYRPEGVDHQALHWREVVDRVVALVAKQGSQQRVTIDVEVPEDLPLIMGNPGQLQQVLLNLVVNALEAMPDGGRLGLRAWAEEGQVILEVCDTGPGVDPEIQDKLFEPFVSSKPTGTGLGLAVSYGIVTAHQGTLTYLPPPNGRGACFRIMLPALEVTTKEVEG